MARRMWKSSFTFYVLLLSFPNVIIGLWLAVYPPSLLPYIFPQESSLMSDHPAAEASAAETDEAPAPSLTELAAAERNLLARLAGLGMFLVSVLLLTGRREPGRNREFMFWIALYFLGLSVLTIAAAYFGEASLWILIGSVYWLVAAIFLMMFASRNLLVRE